MVNKKYVAVAVVALVIIVASAGFLLAQPTDDDKCKVCGMPNCTMDHSNSSNSSNNSHNMSDSEMKNMNMSK